MRSLRSRPCQCGSGRSARDCCGRWRRVSDRDAALGFLARQARTARDLIGPFSTTALRGLQAEAATLPARCDAFTRTLAVARAPVSADLRRLATAVRSPGSGRAIDVAVVGADSPQARVAVAKAIIALRETGAIDEHLAAAALVELVSPRSALTEAAVLAAARELADQTPSPAPHPPAPVRVNADRRTTVRARHSLTRS